MGISDNIQTLFDLLHSPKRIVIVCHQNPDGDAIGSTMGFHRFLTTFGHRVTSISPNEVPHYLQWIAGAAQMLNAETQAAECSEAAANADLIFTLDFGVLNRCAGMEEPIRHSKAVKVNIDHHLEPERFADFTYRDTDALATCELVFRFIDQMGEAARIDADAANAFYTGILTDSGWFSHGHITPETHRTVARLMELGANLFLVNYRMTNEGTLNKTRFFGFCLYERLQVLPEYRAAYMAITIQDQERFNIQAGETEGLVNYCLGISGVNLGLLMVEKSDVVRMSFRSVGKFSARDFAGKFNGGDHFNAAGAKSKLTLAETEARFLELLNEYKEDLQYEVF